MCYSTCASGPTALSVCSRLCLVANCLDWLQASSVLVLYCMMPFIATCVDAIGTVFWDRPDGLSLYELVYGRKAKVAPDLEISVSAPVAGEYRDYVHSLQKQLMVLHKHLQQFCDK